MVIFPPISHVGWARASATVTPSRFSWTRPRKGPPEAVRTKRSTVPGRSAASSWNSAECSESTGSICAPVARASSITSSPPTTSDSLLASARSIPSPSVATVGRSPAEPTMAFRTMSHSQPVISSTIPSEPLSTAPSVQASAARAAASASAIAIRRTPCCRACSSRGCQASAALNATTRSSPAERETTSRAWTPIDPVEPRMARRRGTCKIVGGDLAGPRGGH